MNAFSRLNHFCTFMVDFINRVLDLPWIMSNLVSQAWGLVNPFFNVFSMTFEALLVYACWKLWTFGHLLAELGFKALDLTDACVELDSFGSEVGLFPCILQVLSL